MKIGIHQPQYFMWLGLLHKMLASDRFVYLDSVQFNRRWYQHRALYATSQGSKYLTIPVSAPNHQLEATPIFEIGFGETQEKVLRKHFDTLRHRYGSTPGWSLAKDRLQAFFSQSYSSPCALITASMDLTLDLFEASVDGTLASQLPATGAKDELMLTLTREMGGDVYYSGVGAQDYMRDETFTGSGVQVEYQQFQHPTYRQSHGGAFVEGCGAIDYFFEDPEGAKEYARRIRAKETTQ